MKKILLSIIALTAFVSGYAQGKGNIEFGVNAGYNNSTITLNEYSGTPDSRLSFNVGVSADFYFSDRWSLKAKAIYDRKGWDDELLFIPNLETGSTDIELDYITVPVMANWHFGRKRNWYLNFGPYVGFLISAKETRLNTDIKNEFKSTDAGLAFGIGVKIPVSDKVRLFFEFDGQAGTSEIFEDSREASNSRSAFNVGLNFLLK